MKEISEADVAAITARIEQLSPDILGFGFADPEWSRPPAVKIIDCVLSLNRKYDTFVVPRLETFMSNNPEIQQTIELANLIASYPTPHAFMGQELNYNHEDRARILDSVVKYVCTIVEGTQTIEEEKEFLKQWAIQAKPQECYTLNIKGFKLAGFQYLRMLFRADTAKPDVHIIRFLSNILNRKISAIESLLLLEAASQRAGLSVQAVDSFIWKWGARGERDTVETNTVRLAPDVAVAFPTEEAVNEALRSVLKERDKKQ